MQKVNMKIISKSNFCIDNENVTLSELLSKQIVIPTYCKLKSFTFSTVRGTINL